MKDDQKLSNSFLVYSFVWATILILIFGAFSVLHFLNEVGQSTLADAFSSNAGTTIAGIVCLFLTAPCYRISKSLKILRLQNAGDGTNHLISYSPLFISDMIQAESEIDITNIQQVQQNPYISKLVTLRVKKGDHEQIIQSFISPDLLGEISND